MIKVGVTGALGKMGREVVKTVIDSDFAELVCAIDINNKGEDIGKILLNKNIGVKIFDDIETAINTTKPNVIIDFTQPKFVFENTIKYLNNKVKAVIGTTGLSDLQINELKKISEEKNTACLIAPNFSTGAILMMKFAKEAAKFFDNAEIIEFHHNQKKDAPSGTAIKTAKLMAENLDKNFMTGNCQENETIKGSRGGESVSGIKIHSVRMPSFSASQEVILGEKGQMLTIKHDTTDRLCYMKGVMLAVKYVSENNKFIYGLENII